MTSTPALDFVVFYVSDLTASTEYFCDKLGFTHDLEHSSPVFTQLIGGNVPNFGLFLASAQTPPAGTVEVYFKTNDLPGLREAITGRKVEATEIEHRPFGSIFSVFSPDNQILTMLTDPA